MTFIGKVSVKAVFNVYKIVPLQYWAFQYVKQSPQQACLNYIDIVTEYILNISISKCGNSVQNFVVMPVFQNWLSEMYFLSILRALKCKL